MNATSCINLYAQRSKGKDAQHPNEMDRMDFGELYAYTAVDIYPRSPGGATSRLDRQDGRKALELVMAYLGSCEVLQTDGGKEFGGEFSHGIL